MYKQSKEEFLTKKLSQIISFAGSGGLRDTSQTSSEFREYLRIISSDKIGEYCHQCLDEPFNESGFALQDLVNEIGRRLGFSVENGRYRGNRNEIGFDGIWTSPDQHKIIVEVKSTDAYRINLETVGEYKKRLVKESNLSEDTSVLYIVGREDTGGLEAQVRGSKYAWDIRLISVDALLSLMTIKEDLEDPNTARKIFDILVPREFTKLDGIIEILFSTTEDVKQREDLENEDEPASGKRVKRFTPVSFRDECMDRIRSFLNVDLIKNSFATFLNEKEGIGVVCSISKVHESGHRKGYWFAFHPYQKEFLDKFKKGYLAFGCGSSETILLIPFKEISSELDKLNVTRKEDRFYWHVHIGEDGKKLILSTKQDFGKIELTKYLLKSKTA